jgi:WhiB family transcriptional regulator, redox-sensing transcriptional regulator
MAETTVTPSAQRLTNGAAEARGEAKAGPESSLWQLRAACRDTGPAIFFPAGNPKRAQADEERAKGVCSFCPVRARCLAFAIEHDEPSGVWGGLNAEERRAVATVPPNHEEGTE